MCSCSFMIIFQKKTIISNDNLDNNNCPVFRNILPLFVSGLRDMFIMFSSLKIIERFQFFMSYKFLNRIVILIVVQMNVCGSGLCGSGVCVSVSFGCVVWGVRFGGGREEGG